MQLDCKTTTLTMADYAQTLEVDCLLGTTGCKHCIPS